MRDYLLSLRALAPGSTPSLFLERQLADFQATFQRIETLDVEELDALVAAGSYGFPELPERVSRPQEDPAYKSASEGVGAARKAAKKATATGLGYDKADWEHLRALDFWVAGGSKRNISPSLRH